MQEAKWGWTPGVVCSEDPRFRLGSWAAKLESSLRGLRAILPKWLLLSRLETRTKESIQYASVRVEKPERIRKLRISCETTAADPESLTKGSSKSIFDRTRKMVNFAWVGWSQGKLWWKLEAVLTCKSFVELEWRGERLIEPSSSWFPLKFLSG
jgi:hypothetical protein